MKKSDEYRDGKDGEYAQMMAMALKDIPREKKASSTVQSASTQRLLDSSDEEASARRAQLHDRDFWLELKDKSAAEVLPEEVLIQRTIDKYGIELIDKLQGKRREAKNSIGQSTKSATSQERRAAAQNAWLFTPPAPHTPAEELQIKILEREKVKNPEPIPIEKPKEKFWLWRILAKRFVPDLEEPKAMIDKMDLEDRENWSKTIKEKK